MDTSPRVGVGVLTSLPEGKVTSWSPREDEGAETWGFLTEVSVMAWSPLHTLIIYLFNFVLILIVFSGDPMRLPGR